MKFDQLTPCLPCFGEFINFQNKFLPKNLTDKNCRPPIQFKIDINWLGFDFGGHYQLAHIFFKNKIFIFSCDLTLTAKVEQILTSGTKQNNRHPIFLKIFSIWNRKNLELLRGKSLTLTTEKQFQFDSFNL